MAAWLALPVISEKEPSLLTTTSGLLPLNTRNRIRQLVASDFRPTGEKELRAWQKAAVKQAQQGDLLNMVIVACVASGKTTGSLAVGQQDLLTGRSNFLIVLATNGHLQKSFAEEAQNQFGLQLATYNSPSVGIFNTPKSKLIATTFKELRDKGFHGIVMHPGVLKDQVLDQLRLKLNELKKVTLIIDELHHYGDATETEKLNGETGPMFGAQVRKAFPDEVVGRRILCTGTPFRSDTRKILDGWVKYVAREDGREQMAVVAESHTLEGICDRSTAYVNSHGVVVTYGEHAVIKGWCPEVEFRLNDYLFNWEDVLEEGNNISYQVNNVSFKWINDEYDKPMDLRDTKAKDKSKDYFLNGCKSSAIKPENEFFRSELRKIHSEITRDRHRGFAPRPASACLIIVPGGGSLDNPESGSDAADQHILERFSKVVEHETGERPWVIVGDPSLCQTNTELDPMGKKINGEAIACPSDLIAAFQKDNARYVITQKMIAEGATIQRLDHLFYCGADLTEMFLWQCLGRVLRMYGEGKLAKFWSYPHPIIVKWAETIKAMLDALKKKEGKPGPDGGPSVSTILRRIQHCVHSEDMTIFNGGTYTGDLLGALTYWKAKMKSSMTLGEAEEYLRNAGKLDEEIAEYLQQKEQAADEAQTFFDLDCVLPARIREAGGYNSLLYDKRCAVLKTLLRGLVNRIEWRKGTPPGAQKEDVSPEVSTSIFKKASRLYREMEKEATSAGEFSGTGYEDTLTAHCKNRAAYLLETFQESYTNLNYRWPKNV